MLKDFFGKSKYVTVQRSEQSEKKDQDKKEDNRLWTKCPGCEEIIFNKKLAENLMVCPRCEQHLRLTAPDRLHITVDDDSFIPFAEDIDTENILNFPG
ncbi:MAG: acetyl-CoA carboxylase carboxyl transferase subunit beta, partial [Halanaerobiales bacterium]